MRIDKISTDTRHYNISIVGTEYNLKMRNKPEPLPGAVIYYLPTYLGTEYLYGVGKVPVGR